MAFTGYDDIAPAVSNIFSNISSNNLLSEEAKTKLSDDFFNKMVSIQDIRNKLADQSVAREMNILNLDKARSVLSDTQIDRQRKEAQLANYGATKALVSNVLKTDAPVDLKKQAIAQIGVDTDAATNTLSSNLIDLSLKAIGSDKDPLQNQWTAYGKAGSSIDFAENASGLKDTNKLKPNSEFEIGSYIQQYHPEKAQEFMKLKDANSQINFFKGLTPSSTAAKKAQPTSIASKLF